MFLRPGRLLLIVCFCFCGILLFPTAFSTTVIHAHASGTPITITSETDSVHFPTSIDFQVKVVDTADPITQATFYITYYDQSGALPESRNVQVAHPGKALTLSWHEDTSNSSTFHEAGTPVDYSWNFQDSAGNQYAGISKKFTMIDTRFSWQHTPQGLLQVEWYNRPASFGAILMQNASTALMHITTVLGSGLLHPIIIWVYASDSDFHGALAPNSYEWVGGEALPALNEAFISVTDANDTTLIRDLPHEMTHLVFHQLIADGPQAPTWFDEGLAVYNQAYHEPEMQARFQQALSSDSLLRLSYISDGFSSNADTAYLAYAQSWNLVSYMYSTFGQKKMEQLIKNMDTFQLDFDEALKNALGVNEVQLENQWRLSLNQSSVLSTTQPTPTPVQAPTTQTASGTDILTPLLIIAGVLLVVLPLIALFLIFFYQRRKKRAPVAVPGSIAPAGYPAG
ncbi:MAG TPA: peptidase MA family metallohydrolase, partial [Ktedonobacteraceae bacterium]|nr:peptidase MA family metallohydrolase [Ktedonobacteraceae bacterium]